MLRRHKVVELRYRDEVFLHCIRIPLTPPNLYVTTAEHDTHNAYIGQFVDTESDFNGLLRSMTMEFLDLRNAADVTVPGSLANKFRNRRFAFFANLVERLKRPVEIIDVGGTKDYWIQRGWHLRSDIKVTVVNIDADESIFGNISVRIGSALDLSAFADKSFDVAYSNSVIEHLSSIDNQRLMATEIQRVAACFWVQTPNYWFPIEPHFHAVGWQWMPRSYRVSQLMRHRCGMRGPVSSRAQAEELVDEVRLMTARELKSLFPGATLWRERFFGLTKSTVVYRGFPEAGKS